MDGDGVDDILIADVGRYFDDQASYLVFGGAQALADLDAADGEVDGRIFVEGAVDTPSVILAPSRLTIGEDFTSRISVAISDTNRFDEASLVGAVGVALDADLGELTIDAETSRLVFTPGTAVDGLDAGEVLRGRYRITAEDGGETIVALTILGSDDGDAGNNRLIGSRAADRIEGLEGDDVITGAAGRDLLDGGLGNDVLIGGDGDDRLLDGADNDVLIGGLGADTLTGGEGIDTTSYVQATSAVRADLRGLQAGFGEAEGDLFSGVERLIGSAHDDGLRGDALANTLIGLGGDDNLFAFAGDDFITGGDGNDLIFGGIGADVLRGDAGADTLIGARLTIA